MQARHPRLLSNALTATFIGAFTTLTTTATPAIPAEARAITFNKACESGTRITIAAVGDILYHKQLLYQAFRKNGNFKDFWSPVAQILKRADLAYGNLEGPAAQGLAAGGRRVRDPGRRLDYRVYGYRLPNVSFNYHPSAVFDIKESGFDVISTANNHALDRGWRGVDRTIENFEKAALPFTGTRKSRDDDRPWSVVTPANGISVAWLACTYSANGIPDPHKQVLGCYSQKDEVLAEIKRLHDDENIHAVILTPHWGSENSHYPIRRQKALAREAIEHGATAVIGTHPHVLQPWEKHATESGREGLIIYSTGNFISNQRRMPERTGIIALLELQLGDDNKARLTAAGYIPTWVVIGGRGHRVVENRGRMRWALNHVKRVLPSGNLVRSDDLPRLKKSCAEGDKGAVANWGLTIQKPRKVAQTKKKKRRRKNRRY